MFYKWEHNRSSSKLHYIPKVIEFLGYVPLNTYTKTFGEKIVNYRYLLGIIQKELAKSLGVDPSSLARLERDEDKPSKKYMRIMEWVPL